jgi:squalene-hopene/tetraprenyl-beta-curcumene cyclase
VNYLYGTGAVLTGLARAGVDSGDPMVQSAVRWIMKHQNADGGFGETTQSYKDESLAGHGRTTPSQTAWGLMGLIESGARDSRSARRAVHYLSASFEKNGIWQDDSVVGTGHPGIVYLQYPSYAYAFPLTALARYHR